MPEYEDAYVAQKVKETITKLFDDEEIGELGSNMAHLNKLRGTFLVEEACKTLETLERDVLNYNFKDKKLLLAAVTHPSARSYFQVDKDYEKLEALGDAILDYVININMMRYTMFERYLP